MATTAIPAGPVQVGSRVRYRDAANPNLSGVVAELLPAARFTGPAALVRYRDGSHDTVELREIAANARWTVWMRCACCSSHAYMTAATRVCGTCDTY